jgi:hypothetical protein
LTPTSKTGPAVPTTSAASSSACSACPPRSAELDGLIAHLYGLTESEFTHILTTFPLVAADVKHAALEAFRKVAEETTT